MADTPAFKWPYQHLLPGDWLRTLGVGEDDLPEDFTEESGPEGMRILTNSNVCLLRYIWDNDNPASWDALLVDAMTEVMVAAVAYGITKSTTKKANDEEIVRQVLKTARAVNGQSKTAQSFPVGSILAGRI